MDEATAKRLISAAFADVHSPNDTTERVLLRVASEQTSKHEPVRRLTSSPASRRARIGIAAALGVALVSSGAYAAVRSDLLASAFGTKGQEEVAATQVTGTFTGGPHKGETFAEWRPGVTWQDASEADIQRLVGNYAVEVGSSTTAADVTLTVEGFVTDENGLSVATYSLASDRDMATWTLDAGRGGFSFSEDSPISAVQIWGPGTEPYGYPAKEILDHTSTDNHTLHAVMYFGTWLSATARQGTTWQLSTGGGETKGGQLLVDAPSKLIPATSFASDDQADAQASISPIGAVVSLPQTDTSSELDVDGLSVTYSDGSQEILLSETEDNIPESFVRDDGSLGMLFNRLVDTERIAAVKLTYRTSGLREAQTVTLTPAG